MNHTISQKRAFQDFADREAKLNPQGNSPSMQLLLDYAKGIAGLITGALAAIFVCLLAGVAYLRGLPLLGVIVLAVCMIGIIVLAMLNMGEAFAGRNEP